jgi:uncharacterized membrane protein
MQQPPPLSLIDNLLTRLFVDSVALHRFWHCHRLPERSFFVRGRQFHVCARCTGILIGLIFCFLLVPFRPMLPMVFLMSSIALIIDWGTQFVGLRKSNNGLRFVTGLAVGLTAAPTFLVVGGF